MKLKVIRFASVWIPCEKQMPPDLHFVLVCYDQQGKQKLDIDYPIDGKFVYEGVSGRIPKYWMELPKPPTL